MQTPTTINAIDWSTWKPNEKATLVFIFQGNHILLIDKKTGLGSGKINGPGGRLLPNETPEACAIREVQEELCITPVGIEWAGRLHFQFIDGYSLQGEVFRAHAYQGRPTETREARPIWYNRKEIPYPRMWVDDRLWMPLLLGKTPFQAWFIFDGDAMLDSKVVILPIEP